MIAHILVQLVQLLQKNVAFGVVKYFKAVKNALKMYVQDVEMVIFLTRIRNVSMFVQIKH